MRSAVAPLGQTAKVPGAYLSQNPSALSSNVRELSVVSRPTLDMSRSTFPPLKFLLQIHFARNPYLSM